MQVLDGIRGIHSCCGAVDGISGCPSKEGSVRQVELVHYVKVMTMAEGLEMTCSTAACVASSQNISHLRICPIHQSLLRIISMLGCSAC